MEHQEADPSTVDNAVCNHQNSRIFSTYRNKDGSRVRRHECKDCGHRWSVGKTGTGVKITDEQVLEILSTPLNVSNSELGRRYGVTREAIRQVRHGITHTKVSPDAARPMVGRLCGSCEFFSLESGCRMQFPDFEEIGPAFAGECEAYVTSCDKGSAQVGDRRQN